MLYTANINIERNANPKGVDMPSEERASTEDGLLENHDYIDMRGIDNEYAISVILEEAEILNRIAAIPEDRQQEDLIEIMDELWEACSPLIAFDIGVGGMVHALSAVGCVPISSCNGGVLGDFHSLPHPWVITHAPVSILDFLFEVADRAGVGLANNDNGMLEIYADDIMKFHRMAHLLVT